MNLDRQIEKYGGLQTKVRKKGGTLIKKKKYVFEEEQWVALCVHNSQIPLLEWYPAANEILNHEPTKVLDLFECLFVHISIGDDRCFVIGFVDENRPAIEFAARNADEARLWVNEITKCLRKLNCLSDSSNEYQVMPIQQRPDNDVYESISPGLIRANQLPPAPQPSPIRERTFYNLNAEIPLPTTPAPMLPPRPNNQTSPTSPIPVPPRMMNGGGTSSPPTSPPNSPPMSPRSTITSVFASSPPGMGGTLRRMTKESISSIPETELPPKLPPRKIIPDLNTALPLNEKLLTKTNEASSSSSSSSTTMAGKKSGHQYDFPMSPPPFSVATSPPPTNFNNLNFIESTNNLNNLYSSPIIKSPTILPKAAGRERETTNMAAQTQQYDILPRGGGGTPNSSMSMMGVNERRRISTGSPNTNTNNNEASIIYSCLNNHQNQQTQKQQEHPIYTRFNFPPGSSTASTSEESDYRLSRISNDMVQLRMSLVSSSTEDSNDSTKSQPNESPYSPPPRPPKSLALSSNSINYAGSFREKNAATKDISLLLSLCVEHLALVEVAGSVWIAGWSEEKNQSLCNLIHFGDQIVQCNGKIVRSLNQFPDILHANSTPGVPIPFKIRSLPHGTTHFINKPANLYTPKTFGILFHKKKNRIAEIISLTPAAKAGVLARQQPFLYGREFVSSVITEVNGIPLNPFSNNEQFYKRIDSLSNGSEIRLVTHPYDFIKLIKQQLKNIKNGKKFLQN